MFWCRGQHSAIDCGCPGEKCAYQGVEAVIGIGNRGPLILCDLETFTELFQQPSKKQFPTLACEDVVLGLVGLDGAGEKRWQPTPQRGIRVCLDKVTRTVAGAIENSEEGGTAHRAVGDPVGCHRQRGFSRAIPYQDVGSATFKWCTRLVGGEGPPSWF